MDDKCKTFSKTVTPLNIKEDSIADADRDEYSEAGFSTTKGRLHLTINLLRLKISFLYLIWFLCHITHNDREKRNIYAEITMQL
jgi:hypothetical protein